MTDLGVHNKTFRTVLWIEDSKETIKMLKREIQILFNIEAPIFDQAIFSSIDVLLDKIQESQKQSSEENLVVLLTAKNVEYFADIRNALEKTPLTAIISDLEIGGDSLAGLSVLSLAARANPRPALALFTARDDPSVKLLASNIGIDEVFTKGEDLSLVLAFLQQHLGSTASMSSLREDLERIRTENARLREKCDKLEKLHRDASQASAPSATVTLKDLKALQKQVVELTEALRKSDESLTILLAQEHDLLDTVSLTKQSLDRACSDPQVIPPVIKEELRRATNAAKHSAILMSSLRDLMGDPSQKRNEAGLISRALNEAAEIIGRNIPNDVELLMNVPEKLPPSKMPEHVIVRCALNLILNSVESIKGRGRISVSTMAPENSDAKHLSVVFQDNGEGIIKRDLPKIFEMNFSTKGKKTGIGLFVVNRFCDAYGGQVNVSSVRGKGTKVTFQVPLS